MLKYVYMLLFILLGSMQGILGITYYDAIAKGDIRKVEELINKGVKIDAADVAFAALKGNVEIVACFLSKRAPLDNEALRSAVRGACDNKKSSKPYEDVVHMLLKARAPFDKTTLGMAAKCGNIIIIQMLVNAMPFFNA